MTKKRVFVAINLPDDVKNELAAIISKIGDNYNENVRFISRDNWHLTISFLGEQTDDNISSANQAIEGTAKKFMPPNIQFEKIIYGPIGKTPRMIWLVASRRTSDRLGEIKADLEKGLFEAGINFEQEHRQYNAHLTLARFSAVGRESLPPLDIEFDRQFQPASLVLTESHLKRSGAEYEPLAQFDFEGDSE